MENDILIRLRNYQNIQAPQHLYQRLSSLLIPALISENSRKTPSWFLAGGFGITIFVVLVIGIIKLVSSPTQPQESKFTGNYQEQVTQNPKPQKDTTANVTTKYIKPTTTPTPSVIPSSLFQGETKGIQTAPVSSKPTTSPSATPTPQLAHQPTPSQDGGVPALVGNETPTVPSQNPTPDVSIDIPPQTLSNH